MAHDAKILLHNVFSMTTHFHLSLVFMLQKYFVTYASTIMYALAFRTTFVGLQPLITTYRTVTKSTLSYSLIMVSFCFSCGTPCKAQKGLENHVKSRPKCLHDLGIARAESLGLSPSSPLAQLINHHSFRFETDPNLASKRSVEVMWQDENSLEAAPFWLKSRPPNLIKVPRLTLFCVPPTILLS
jgi:hypothetical protein